jgi:uncharacterized protein (DUF362 family)
MLTRRELVGGLLLIGTKPKAFSLNKSAARVAVAKCHNYGSELLPTMERMVDQLGGLGRLVKNRTVAIKLNLTGTATSRMGCRPAGLAQWPHPQVVAATVHLLDKASARRIRLLESPWSTADPLEEFLLQAGWDPDMFVGCGKRVEFENTNWLGSGKKYSRLVVPYGGYVYKAYDFNHSYEDCDVFVSLAKLKEHGSTGITLSMKNCFGNLPATIYGEGAGKDEPSLLPQGGRHMLHSGKRQPAGHMEIDPSSPREEGYRVPRVVVDVVAARPIDLAIIDGIESMAGGEGPWIRGVRPISPKLLVAGTNCVATDSVATALMGFDPMADRGTAPFEKCDSTLRLAEAAGLGPRDLRQIEVVGVPIAEAVCRYRSAGTSQM